MEKELFIVTKNNQPSQQPIYTFVIDRVGYTFGIMGSPTGCGLGLFYSFINNISQRIEKKEIIDMIKTLIKQTCLPSGICCLIATLGDSHRVYDPFLTELGFVEVHKYENNILHGKGYKQSIYELDVTKL